MRWPEIARMEGAPSYRQMDYWTTMGLIKAENGAHPGSGRQREWSPRTVADACRIKALSDLGLKLSVIRTILATEMDTIGHREAEVAPGVWIDVA